MASAHNILESTALKEYLLTNVITPEILNILNFVVFTRRYVSEMKQYSGERGQQANRDWYGMRLMLRIQV